MAPAPSTDSRAAPGKQGDLLLCLPQGQTDRSMERRAWLLRTTGSKPFLNTLRAQRAGKANGPFPVPPPHPPLPPPPPPPNPAPKRGESRFPRGPEAEREPGWTGLEPLQLKETLCPRALPGRTCVNTQDGIFGIYSVKRERGCKRDKNKLVSLECMIRGLSH